jgi:hypothetical protein
MKGGQIQHDIESTYANMWHTKFISMSQWQQQWGHNDIPPPPFAKNNQPFAMGPHNFDDVTDIL